jgi:hypothetical protein
MSVLTSQSASTTTPRPPASPVGYRVFGPEGWIGTVTEAYGEDWLLVRTGLFHRRWLTVPHGDIERVDTICHALTVSRDPRECVASRLTEDGGVGW